MSFRILLIVTLLASVSFAQEDPGSVEGFIDGEVRLYDTNADGFVYDDDVDEVINHLRAGSPYDFNKDVNLDFAITPLDALLVINLLRRNPWQNLTNDPTDVFDVNNSNGATVNDKVTPLDALLVINETRRRENSGETPVAITQDDGTTIDGYKFTESTADQPSYFDVDGDELVSSNDAQLVIDQLRRQSL